MIRSCRDKDVFRLLDRQFSRRFQSIEATSLEDLRLPGLRLEALKGDRRGQHSIRINDRLRICFAWRDGDAHNVEIVDYH